MHLPRLPADPAAPFPAPASALRRPPGLLAWGGDLSLPRLLNAYRHGIFPWYSDGQPILWWSPDPRMVFDSARVRVPRRLRRTLARQPWRISADRAFEAVLRGCASAPRGGQRGTWITADMQAAYVALHAAGHAHSIEAWDGEVLAGGIYGVRIGRMFFGESMFSAHPGGSKVALAALCAAMHAAGMPLLDGQVDSAHLRSLGAVTMPRAGFLRALAPLVAAAPVPGWPGAFVAAGTGELG